jgi:uncharacterized protein YjbJ (UPF0337 family)
MAQISVGKVEEVLGKATNDQELEAQGNEDQLEGHLKQAVENAKDVLKP